MTTTPDDHKSGPSNPAWGVLLPSFDVLRTGRTPALISGARRAEELGFDAGWVGDHLVCHVPLLDSTMALSAAAAVTTRLAFGFSVMLLGLRAPEAAAAQIATVDALSGGRLSLGVGVGGEHPEEFAAAGVPMRQRGRRLDEMLAVLPDLIAGHAVDFAGEAIEVHAPARERPLGRVPRIIVGGRGEAAVRRVARHGDAWLPMWLSPDAIDDRMQQLAQLAAAAGRPAPAAIVLVLVCVDDDLEAARQTAAEHLQSQYHLPLSVVERWAALGPAASVAEQLQRYLDVGVGELILMPLGGRPLEQYERLAAVRELMPAAAV